MKNTVYIYTPTWSQKIATMLVRDVLLIDPNGDKYHYVTNAGPVVELIETMGFEAKLGYPSKDDVLSVVFEHGVPKDHDAPTLYGEIVVQQLDEERPRPNIDLSPRTPYTLPSLSRPNAFKPYDRPPPPNHDGIITDGIVNVFFG